MILFLVYDKNYIYFPDIKRKTLVVKDMWKPGKQYCFWSKVCRKLRLPLSLWGRFFMGEWVGELDQYEQIIVFDAVYEPMIGRYLKQKGMNAYIYMWDGKNRSRLSGKQIFPVLSFNPRDTENGMLFQRSFYCREILEKIDCTNQYDVFYCGRVKRRWEVIRKYCLFFKSCGFSVNFHVVSDSGKEEEEGIPVFTKELSYYENLLGVSTSRAVLNIVDPDEFGAVTQRCLEALYLQKKLITNDTQICETDLYHRNNVYILKENFDEEEEKKAIKEFLQAEYVPPAQELLAEYDINFAVFGSVK